MYEYTLREFEGDTPSIIEWLNECGRDGWEAFATELMPGGGHRVWLKRQQSGVAGGLTTGGDAARR